MKRILCLLAITAICSLSLPHRASAQTAYQTCAFSDPTHCYGIGPGTAGQAYVSNGPSAYPSFSASLPGVTSIGGVTIPATASEFVTAPTTITSSLCLLSTTTAGLGSWEACPGGGAGGTVTSVSVASANGVSGTVATPTTTPVITLATTFTGIAYSNGSGFAAAVAGNFPTLNQSTTGNAATATALAATPTQCSSGEAANGVAANGNAQGCFTPSGSGTVNSGTSGQVGCYAATGTAISGCGLANGLAINSGTLGISEAVNPQTGTSYTVATTDCGKQITLSNAASIAVSVPQANGSFAGCQFDVTDVGAGTATLTPTTSTINGSASLAIAQNRQCTVNSDGANWQVIGCTALVAGGGSGTPENVQVFTASGTWTKPSGSPQTTDVLCVGGGGSGGGGAVEPSGTEAGGGGAGGGASAVEAVFSTSSLSSTVSVTVATAAVGGASKASTSTGSYGNNGGNSTFGSYLIAYGGGQGAGGQSGGNTAGGSGGGVLSAGNGTSSGGMCGALHGSPGSNAGCPNGGGGGGDDSSTGGSGSPGGPTLLGGSGGGAGGGITTGAAASAGGAAGAIGALSGASGGAIGASGTPGGTAGNYGGGSGGGGGGSSVTGNAGAGGNASIGGGGGGGGAALNGVGSSGAGGNGGAGECVAVTTY